MTWRVPFAITLCVAAFVGLMATLSMSDSQDTNSRVELETVEALSPGESISVVFPDYTFVTQSGIDGLRVTPDSTEPLYLGEPFSIEIEYIDSKAKLELEATTVELIPLNGAPEIAECRGPIASQTEGDASANFALDCQPEATGTYLLRVQSNSGLEDEPSSVHRQVHSEIISILARPIPEQVSPSTPKGSISVSFEFLEGSGDSWWHPPLYSFESGALVRRVCDPGDDYYGYGKTGTARPIEADGVVGPILAYGVFEGECTVPPEQGLGGINTGLAGRSWAIRIPAAEIEKLLPPAGCLKIRFDSGELGNSFNVVCLRRG